MMSNLRCRDDKFVQALFEMCNVELEYVPAADLDGCNAMVAAATGRFLYYTI